ncbi:Predicted Zn-dependent peptidase [Anaerovirgula multivorans]|uniref:Predicted Zn-dependent peptidase n=1 Tax=Anaerovirgula multivorans TaxID=312168 RepID=A0A239A049_9FIRM|nr:pitrilysin family protein [Anaerovirgula multivorans]SNR88782.1 Predicted Zn-dependent peptidase [Anaerovirgula multivorans]
MYKKYTLDNGLRVVTEHIPFVKSISIGVWIETGSKQETINNNGISHFIEHMLFKGTTSKSAKEIAELIDGIGGQINAFTSKECTCYYTKVLDSHYELAIDLLADMLFNSKFDKEDIQKEKSVIYEEISMYEDSPEDLAHDLLYQSIFKNSSLGFPILGTNKSLESIERDEILNYMQKYYVPNNAVISIAGNFDEGNLLKVIEDKFGKWEKTENLVIKEETLDYNFTHYSKSKDIEQVHLCLGFKGIPLGENKLYPLLVVNNILGGSMSSRLFQNIREDRGLAYSIYSYPSTYKGGGLLSIYAGMNPNLLDEVSALIYSELENLSRNGLTALELNKSKEQLKGNYILGLESTSSRMTSIGKSELLLHKIYSPKEIIQKIDDVGMSEVGDIIKEIIDLNHIASTTVGKIERNLIFNKAN